MENSLFDVKSKIDSDFHGLIITLSEDSYISMRECQKYDISNIKSKFDLKFI